MLFELIYYSLLAEIVVSFDATPSIGSVCLRSGAEETTAGLSGFGFAVTSTCLTSDHENL